MKNNISKFAPRNGFPNLRTISGIKLASINANISKGDKLDLLLIKASQNSIIAGLFTKSETCSAAVEWSRKNMKKCQSNKESLGILVNSGNANVFTGSSGTIAVKESVSSVARYLNAPEENIFIASTGVIGEFLDQKKIISKADELVKKLKPDSFFNAAKAIMTTDTFPKGVHTEFTLNGIKIKINGLAKGSGMIAPNMATMLVFIFSDIAIEKHLLQKIITRCNKKTFNCITVDSDTSTSDSLFAIATGKAKMTKITSLKDPRVAVLEKYLTEIMLKLAKLVIKDGEGITKFIEVIVKGAKHNKDAIKIGKAIAESPLVKTAFAGEDANWGRIVMAIGKSGIKIKKEKISIYFGEQIVAQNGSISKHYNEVLLSEYMKKDSLAVTVDLGIGQAKASIYTCDLTHDYISINADYRS